MIDYTKAATAATETLIKYAVTASPVAPLPMLKKMKNVVVISFSDISEDYGIKCKEMIPMFEKNLDAITSVFTENGARQYIVAYNNNLPFNMVQRALAREMGHIVLGHDGYSEENNEEAMCYAYHLLCPRSLIHALQATCLRLTTDLLANLTGVYDQSIVAMRRIPATDVPKNLNCFVRNQFMPFVMNLFGYYRYVLPKDGSALVDLGTFMEGYVE